MSNDWSEQILDRFRYIESQSGDDCPGVTAKELSRKFLIRESAAQTWLSKWCNYYRPSHDVVYHVLRSIKNPDGGPKHYKLGPTDYSDFAWEGNRECQRQIKLDFSGLKPMHLDDRGREIHTRTDSITHKRTAAGIRTTNEKLYWIKMFGGENGISVQDYADKFKTSKACAAVTLSRWKRHGIIIYENGKYKISKEQIISSPSVFYDAELKKGL